MQQQEVLELIESVVRPLKQKIDHLEKQNEQLRTQMAVIVSHHPEPTTRLRSSSRGEQRNHNKEDVREVRSPSIEKRDKKPGWNVGKLNKQDKPVYKSPPPVEKNKYKQVAAKVTTRYSSKEKNHKTNANEEQQAPKEEVKYLSFQKPKGEVKKIMGGQKFSENGSINQNSSNNGSVSGGNKYEKSLEHNSKKVNPENSNSQEGTEQGGSQLLPEEVPSEAEE